MPFFDLSSPGGADIRLRGHSSKRTFV
jgi:hypothetical protein